MKNLVTLTTVLILTLGALFLWDSPPQRLLKKDQITSQKQKSPPDFYIKSISAHTYNENGELNHTLTADNSFHYKREAKTELEHPKMLITREDGSLWYSEAHQGEAIQNGNIIRLHGKVKLQQFTSSKHYDTYNTQPQNQRPETEITTSQLTLKPKSKVATTKKAVTIRTPDNKVDSVGLHANLSQQQIELLSRVQGEHRVQ
ncbi:MAG: LPS export ABC transporter periplasmic protein LptC [Cellvibrionaceae bacterium]